MDLKTALNYRGPYEEAYTTSREQEIVNNQRVAQAEQLLNEARLKSEMQPYDIASKEAQTENYLAMARGLGNYSKDKPVNPKHTAEAQAKFQAILYPYLSAIHGEKDEGKRLQLRDQLLKMAQEYNYPLEGFIDSPKFLETMGRSAEAAKLQGIDKQGNISINLQGMKGDQALQQIDRRGQWDKKAAEIKASAGVLKTEDDIKKLQAKYLKERNNAKTPEEKDYWGGLYADVSAQIVTEKGAAATAGPAAKAEANRGLLQGLMTGRTGTLGSNAGKTSSGVGYTITQDK